MKIKLIILNFIFLIIILWQLWFWFEFSPGIYGDPYIDLAPLFYWVLCIPVSVIGLILSVIVIKKSTDGKSEKRISWIVFIISFCTAIPPLFLIVRYIFTPLNFLIGS